MEFKVGDKVEWFSSYKEKEGEIIAVIPKGVEPLRIINKIAMERNLNVCYGGGRERDHESYVVLVPHPGKGMGSLYWPRVSALQKVD